jgi:hypothetical protein
MGEYAKGPSPTTKDSLTTRLESLLGRLEKNNHRLSNVVDRLIGPSPSQVQEKDTNHDCLRRAIDRGHELMNAYESELDRLGDSL